MKKALTVGSLKSRIQPERKEMAATIKKIAQTEPRNSRNKPIFLIQNGKNYSISYTKHQTLLDAALEQGNLLNYKCKKGTCGKCQVQVRNGQHLLTPPNEAEHKKLGPALYNGDRLACQTRMVQI